MLLPTLHGASLKKQCIAAMQLSNTPAATLFQHCSSLSSTSSCPRRRITRVRASRAQPAERTTLPAGQRAESLPHHVAVAMDGHGRWARARGMPTSAGHATLPTPLVEMVRLSRAWGIRVLTAFAFSRANWDRPKEEVDFLMGLFDRFIEDNVEQFAREGIHLHVIGDWSRLPTCLQKTARDAEEATRNNSQLHLMLAISYSGQHDILQACRNLAQKVHGKQLQPEDIDESLFAHELLTSCTCTDDFRYPDLLIRTGGELRLSDFLLWQSAYTELSFTNTLWPDYGEADYLQALMSFQTRDRRFGKRKLV